MKSDKQETHSSLTFGNELEELYISLRCSFQF